LVPIHTANSIATDSQIDLAIMSGLESTDKNSANDTTDGGTASINDAPPTSSGATKEAIKALDARLAAWEAKLEGFDASMAGLATDNAMMEDRDAHFAEWVDAKKTQLRKLKEVRDAFVQQGKKIHMDYSTKYSKITDDMAVKDRETGARQMKVSRAISLGLTVLSKYRIAGTRSLIASAC
jgi:hypothetical protein